MNSDNENIMLLAQRMRVMEDHVEKLKDINNEDDVHLINKLNYQIDELIDTSIRLLTAKRIERNNA